MPTAPGTAGQWYQAWVSPEIDAELQKSALKLYKQGKILDDNGHKPKLRTSPDGTSYVPHYAVAKYALLELLNHAGEGKK